LQATHTAEPMTAQTASQVRAGGYGEDLGPGQRAPGVYAASAVPSRGRYHPETECPTRSPFQRDRDRVLHATAFRRLTHKTQVFLYHEGDHFRTRLTHSLEVAQIARTVARQLRLDEDLAEALALAHDLGHSPFGHAGERALDRSMASFGGFDHNAQSVRIVTVIERKYRDFDGLNLTWETLEGLAKHNGPLVGAKHAAVLKVIQRFETWKSLNPLRWASGEAQVAALADDIAYLSHDVDDGLRAGLLTLKGLADVAYVGPFAQAAMAHAETTLDGRAIFDVTRRMITRMISDVVGESREQLRALQPKSPDEIRSANAGVIAFSPTTAAELEVLRAYLFENVYRHERVTRVMGVAEQIVADLFDRYSDAGDPVAMPGAWANMMRGLNDRQQARLAADYLAGQTDRYALAEHRRLFGLTPDLRP
jgi:dGTPase